MKCDKCGYDWGDSGDSAHACAFYQTLKPSTHSPQRTWVGLTDKERNSLYAAHHNKYDLPNQGSPDGMDYERAIEAKLKEKNT